MSKSTPLLAAALCAGLAAPLAAWGVQGHQIVPLAALQDLPPGPAAWLAGQEAVLRDHASDPDQWKDSDPLERPRHHLDCEPYGGPGRVPLVEGQARAMLGDSLFQQSGQVPWSVLDRVNSLTAAFTSGDPGAAALAASILSHYVGDLSVPLHTTSNHNGDDTGQHGVHKRWETGLVERILEEGSWLPEVRTASLGANSAAAPWVWLGDSFRQVPGLLADDLAAEGEDPDGGHGDAYWQTFMGLEGPRVEQQLSAAGQRTAQMILMAWTAAGSPPAPL